MSTYVVAGGVMFVLCSRIFTIPHVLSPFAAPTRLSCPPLPGGGSFFFECCGV